VDGVWAEPAARILFWFPGVKQSLKRRPVHVFRATYLEFATSPGREPIERITGSLAFAALSRIVLSATKGKTEDAPRRLVRIASNIGPAGGGLEYTLAQELLPDYDFSAQRVLWGQRLTGSAAELLNDGVQEKLSEGAKAEEFLTKMLSEAGNAGVDSLELKQAAVAHSIAWRTVERAKEKLGGIRVKRRNGATAGGWYWVQETGSTGVGTTGVGLQ
jgi:putative DNA primase/helicase